METEIHVLTQCQAYEPLRNLLYNQAKEINEEFSNMNDEQKCMFLLSNSEIARLSAKTCYYILQARYDILYQ